ncbi:hypothetical protein ACNO7O_06825 [Bisgaard Taxon 45]
MPINLLSEEGMIKKSLSEKYESLIQRPQLAEYLSANIRDWFKKTEKIIQQKNPFPKFRQQWEIWNSEFHKNKSVLNDKTIREYRAFCQSVGIPFESSFWHKKLESNNEDKEIVSGLLLKEWQKNLDKSEAQWELEKIELARKKFLAELESNNEEKKITSSLLLKEWQKNLDKSEAQWELEQIDLARKKFLTELEKWLELIQQLDQQLSSLGLDFGIWFDDSLGYLTPTIN